MQSIAEVYIAQLLWQVGGYEATLALEAIRQLCLRHSTRRSLLHAYIAQLLHSVYYSDSSATLCMKLTLLV